MIFSNIETNLISKRDDLEESLKNKVPEWAIYFEWIVSNWDKNRNWYIIDEEAWFMDKGKYVKMFLKSWSVLWAHDSDKPIGRPLTFEKTDKGIRVSWYVFDDAYTNWSIGRKIVLWLSTWHFTHDSIFRNNKTWEEIPRREFIKKLWSDEDIMKQYRAWEWDWVVTKAEIVEFSFVSVPSNRVSTVNDTIANEISKTLNIDLTEVKNNLFGNNSIMNLEEAKIALETSQNEVKTLKETATTNEAETKTLKEANETLTSENSTLKETATTNEADLKTAKDSLETSQNRVKTLEDEEKERVLANANTPNGKETPKKKDGKLENVADFQEKYSK